MRREIIIYTVLVVAMICLSYYLWCDCNCSQNYICKAAIKPVENFGALGVLGPPRELKKVIFTTTTTKEEEKEEKENFDETTPKPKPKTTTKTTIRVY